TCAAPLREASLQASREPSGLSAATTGAPRRLHPPSADPRPDRTWPACRAAEDGEQDGLGVGEGPAIGHLTVPCDEPVANVEAPDLAAEGGGEARFDEDAVAGDGGPADGAGEVGEEAEQRPEHPLDLGPAVGIGEHRLAECRVGVDLWEEEVEEPLRLGQRPAFGEQGGELGGRHGGGPPLSPPLHTPSLPP